MIFLNLNIVVCKPIKIDSVALRDTQMRKIYQCFGNTSLYISLKYLSLAYLTNVK